nr:hypothetical protein [Tanacetum cinerariifolium]
LDPYDIGVVQWEKRIVPAGIGARAHGEVERGVLILFQCRCVYRRVSCGEGFILAGNVVKGYCVGELDLLFEAMYDDYIGGQPSASARTVPPAQEHQVRQTSMASTTIADTAPIPTNSSSLATNIPITSQDVDELNPNAMVDGNTFVNPFANSSTSVAASSSQQNVDRSNMHTFYQPCRHEFQWTKDHPLDQVIGEPSRPVLTRNQL